jgi:hypothetical protein
MPSGIPPAEALPLTLEPGAERLEDQPGVPCPGGV